MFTLHIPRAFEHVGTGIKHSDPVAWVVLMLALGTLAAIFAVTYFR